MDEVGSEFSVLIAFSNFFLERESFFVLNSVFSVRRSYSSAIRLSLM